jgi:hypothetical protein
VVELPTVTPHQKLLRGGKSRWLRVKDLPFSRGHTYRLLFEGILQSVELRVPGSKRSVRLIDGESLDKYLLNLSREQQPGRKKVTTCPKEEA